ncbi:MAG: hypothetical protein HYT43_00575 [Candidatus Taylorbacteria bacterium]|nr:hypothetical protein [Candidatus Taylorbacteria bacterium]
MEQQNQSQQNQNLNRPFLDEAKQEKNKKMKITLLSLAALLLVVGTILILREVSPSIPVSEGKTRVSGKAIALSDVQTIPDRPLTVGIIGAIPEERFDAFVTEARGAGVASLDQNIIFSYVVNSSSFDAQGSFQFEVEPGLYVLCYFFPATSSEAMRLEACGKTHLGPGEQLSLQIGKMFGTSITGKNVETIPLTEIYPSTSDFFGTSTWQTYRNDEFGFELKYPSEFEVYGADRTGISAQSQSGAHQLIGINIIEGKASLQAYLTELEQLQASAYEGDPSVAVLRRYETTTAGYPSITREVQLLAAALTQIETFIDVSPKMIVSIHTREGYTREGEYKEPQPDRSLKQLHDQILSTFRLFGSHRKNGY